MLGSRKSWRLQLENTGDVGTRFTWDTEALGANFSITPAEGFVAPGQDVMLLVEFHPVEVSRDVRVERVRCSLEGAEPQHLTLTGRCEPQDAEGVETLAFETRVRGETSFALTYARLPTSGSGANGQGRGVDWQHAASSGGAVRSSGDVGEHCSPSSTCSHPAHVTTRSFAPPSKSDTRRQFLFPNQL